MVSWMEVNQGKRYRHPGRYRQWLLGRATAKTLIWRYAAQKGIQLPPPQQLHILRTPEGRPWIFSPHGSLPISLSVSHADDKALCMICPQEEGVLGADMEKVASRPSAFLEDFYTEAERAWLSHVPPSEQPKTATLIWCVKEAILKARGTGLHENTKIIDVQKLDLPSNQEWQPAEVTMADGSMPRVFVTFLDQDQLAIAGAQILHSREDPRFPARVNPLAS